MFRFYEAWIILLAPFVVLLAIMLCLLILFVRGDLSASPIQNRKETFGKLILYVLWRLQELY